MSLRPDAVGQPCPVGISDWRPTVKQLTRTARFIRHRAPRTVRPLSRTAAVPGPDRGEVPRPPTLTGEAAASVGEGARFPFGVVDSTLEVQVICIREAKSEVLNRRATCRGGTGTTGRTLVREASSSLPCFLAGRQPTDRACNPPRAFRRAVPAGG